MLPLSYANGFELLFLLKVPYESTQSRCEEQQSKHQEQRNHVVDTLRSYIHKCGICIQRNRNSDRSNENNRNYQIHDCYHISLSPRLRGMASLKVFLLKYPINPPILAAKNITANTKNSGIML